MIRPSRFLIAAALTASLGFAQFRTRAANGSGTPPDPATMIQMRVAYLTSLLSLNTAQQAQATTIFTNAYNSGQSIHTSLQTDQQELDTAVKANNIATIDQLTTAMGTLQGQLIGINAKADAAFYAILTPDQQSKYDSVPHGGPGFGPGSPGPHGAPPPPPQE